MLVWTVVRGWKEGIFEMGEKLNLKVKKEELQASRHLLGSAPQMRD